MDSIYNFFNLSSVQAWVKNPSDIFDQDTAFKVGAAAVLGLAAIGALYIAINRRENKAAAALPPARPTPRTGIPAGFDKELGAAVASRASGSGGGTTKIKAGKPTYLEGGSEDESSDPSLVGTTVFKSDALSSPPIFSTIASQPMPVDAGFIELCRTGNVEWMKAFLRDSQSTKGGEYLDQCVNAFELTKAKKEKNGLIQGICALVELGKIDINAKLENGMSLLRFVCSIDVHSSTELIVMLLGKEADFQTKIDGKTPFDELSVEKVEELLKVGGLKDGIAHQTLRVLKANREVLINLCLQGDLDGAKGVLENIDPNFKIEGRPFLHELITHPKFVEDRQSFEKILSMLIEGGRVDLNAKGPKERTLLHMAVNRGFANAVRLLGLSERVKFNEEDENGETPLHYACGGAIEFNLDTILALLEQGADPKIKNASGREPFHLLRTESAMFPDGSLPRLKEAIRQKGGLKHFMPQLLDAEEVVQADEITSKADGPADDIEALKDLVMELSADSEGLDGANNVGPN